MLLGDVLCAVEFRANNRRWFCQLTQTEHEPTPAKLSAWFLGGAVGASELQAQEKTDRSSSFERHR